MSASAGRSSAGRRMRPLRTSCTVPSPPTADDRVEALGRLGARRPRRRRSVVTTVSCGKAPSSSCSSAGRSLPRLAVPRLRVDDGERASERHGWVSSAEWASSSISARGERAGSAADSASARVW